MRLGRQRVAMKRIELELVEQVPGNLDAGKLYVSLKYRTSAHLCGCGCGTKVVLKLSPRHWCVIFNGETVSMYPSIGNWQLPCRSHYWIRDGRVVVAAWWSDAKIERERRRTKGQLTAWPSWLRDKGEDRKRQEPGRVKTDGKADPPPAG